MEDYQVLLKESLLNLDTGIMNEYLSVCDEKGLKNDINAITQKTINLISLCSELDNYMHKVRSTLNAYQAGAFGVSGDNKTDEYQNKIQIRINLLIEEIEKTSELSDNEKSQLMYPMLMNGFLHFGPMSNKQKEIICSVASKLNNNDLKELYENPPKIFAYSPAIEQLLKERGVEAEKKKRGGCYVATCVYGSYDCPQVWTLRRFRDNILSNSVFGRLFIKAYYAISPTIVELFGSYKWFHKMWKAPLDKLVQKLLNNGVEDAPYND